MLPGISIEGARRTNGVAVLYLLVVASLRMLLTTSLLSKVTSGLLVDSESAILPFSSYIAHSGPVPFTSLVGSRPS